MITFTKEQLIEHLRTRIEHRKGLISSMHIDRGYRDYLKLELLSSEIALASLEAEKNAEPVAKVETVGVCWYADNGVPRKPAVGTELYTTPPAPVSVPDEQHSERFNWTLGQWAEHVGGHHQRNDPANYYEFGSFMAVAAMLSQFGTVQQKIGWNACRSAMLQGADGNSPVIPDWQAEAEKMAEIHGTSFVVFRNGESQQCAEPSKVIISFTDEGLGHGSAAPQQEVKP